MKNKLKVKKAWKNLVNVTAYVVMTLSILCVLASLLFDFILMCGRKLWLLESVNFILKIFDINATNAYIYTIGFIAGGMYIGFVVVIIKNLIFHFKKAKKACSSKSALVERRSAWSVLILNYGKTISLCIIFIAILLMLHQATLTQATKISLGTVIIIMPLLNLHFDSLFEFSIKQRLCNFTRIFLPLIAIYIITSLLSFAPIEKLITSIITLSQADFVRIGGREFLYIAYNMIMEPILIIILTIIFMRIIYLILVHRKDDMHSKWQKNGIYKSTLIYLSVLNVLRCIIITFCTSSLENIDFGKETLISMFGMIKESLFPLLLLTLAIYILNKGVPTFDSLLKKHKEKKK